jgi:DNA-binding winged helix-turn-helix (wHTH) protein/tetratricopeptide (TPR) repeat protein
VIRHTYRFGQYSIDPATRELYCAGELVAISPKLFDCLAWLIEHRDRAVGRDELVAAVWGKTDIADTQLVQAILKARRAVGDSGEEQRVIRTIPRFGYRWVGDVEVEHVASADASANAPMNASAAEFPAAAPVAAVRARRGKRPMFAALVLLAMIVSGSGVAWWSMRHNVSSTQALVAALPAVAVLPATVSADSEWNWLRLGLMDLVADRVRASGLAVVPSDNVVALVRGVVDPSAAEQAVRQATTSRWTVQPVARRDGAGWTVSLALREGSGQPRVVEAGNADPAAATREAVSRLLPLLGRSGTQEGEAHDDLVPRIRAALLGSDYAAAQRQLDTATSAQREMPEIRLLQGQVDFGNGRFDSARTGFTQLLADMGEKADPLLRARVYNGRGACLIRLSDTLAAERDFDAALDLLRDRDEPATAGQAYTGRGVARAMQRRDDAAIGDFARARIALQLANDTLALALVEANEGALNAQRGHPADALASFQRAAEHFERFGAHNELARSLTNQAEVYLDLLEPDRALELDERAQAMTAQLEDPSMRNLVVYSRAHALAAVGRLAEAREQFDALLRSPEAIEDVELRAMSRNRKAALALAAGEAESAAASARQAVADAATGPWDTVRGEAWLTLTRALRSEGKDAEAAGEVGRFAAWARDEVDHSVVTLARLAQAEQAWGDRQRDAAIQGYTDALAMAERDAVPADIARVGVSWGNTLIAEGELEAAGPVVGRLARWASTDFSCALLQARLYRALGHLEAWQGALAQTRALAGERAIPAVVAEPPSADAPLASKH